jgi:ribonuclease III
MMFFKRLWTGIRTLGWLRKTVRLEDLKVDISELQRNLSIQIKNPSVFIQALLHRSYLVNGKTEEGYTSNERLEFFGDSVLSLIISEYLYEKFPHSDEGHLTKLRSRLINKNALACLAQRISLLDFVFVSQSARQSIEQGYDSMLADAYEAIVAAIYIDSGYDAVRAFVIREVEDAIDKQQIELLIDDNYKSLLIEYTQGVGIGIPRYEVVRKEGPDHDQTFTVEVKIDYVPYGIGVGKSKKEAEQQAASTAYTKMIQSKNTKGKITNE